MCLIFVLLLSNSACPIHTVRDQNQDNGWFHSIAMSFFCLLCLCGLSHLLMNSYIFKIFHSIDYHGYWNLIDCFLFFGFSSLDDFTRKILLTFTKVNWHYLGYSAYDQVVLVQNHTWAKPAFYYSTPLFQRQQEYCLLHLSDKISFQNRECIIFMTPLGQLQFWNTCKWKWL